MAGGRGRGLRRKWHELRRDRRGREVNTAAAMAGGRGRGLSSQVGAA